ncbi:GNAT family N-acetyltransferase [Proteiniphilum sp.]|uniref:GNAT family N-acetyltransferase n=1 Tax=Proteiniphilum sp. TaxID=1926877 RepID=UPI00332D52A7
MNYFIFNYETDKQLIDSFLESASLAHKIPQKTKEWFLWKFRDNPYGEAILACAEEDEKIVGCVAYGMQPFWLKGEKREAVLSFETFVHPQYQGKGIFSNLIELGEKEVISKKIDFMLNFPNSNSLRGFLKKGWKSIDNPDYWIKGRNVYTIPLGFKYLKKGFHPNQSNLTNLILPMDFIQSPKKQLTSVITPEYLKWRFFTYPVSEYRVIENENFHAVIRVGKRGNLNEGQVLFMNEKNKASFKMNSFLKLCKSKFQYDILSFSISKNNPIRKNLLNHFFIKVPNQANICYKIIDDKKITRGDIENLSLSAINYHTY